MKKESFHFFQKYSASQRLGLLALFIVMIGLQIGYYFTPRSNSIEITEQEKQWMALQEEISFGRQQRFIGRELDVLVERINTEEGFAEGRSYREAPEVDGIVEIRNIRSNLQEGDVIKVLMTDAMPHDMIGEETKE